MLEVEFGSKDGTCLSCSDKEHDAVKIKINCDKNDKNIISFHLCRKCLNKLAREFQPYS